MFIFFAKEYLAKIKNLSIFFGIFFIVSFFLGYVLAHNYPEQTKEIIYEALKDIIEPAKDYSPFQLFFFIFFKNLTVAIMSVLLGIFFGIIPILIIFLNGLALGIVLYIFLEQYNVLVFLAGILPHGIFEIPAIIFSVSGGVWLWQSIYRRILYGKGEPGKEFLSIIKFFTLIILPMLAIAAIIETFATPYVLDLAVLLL